MRNKLVLFVWLLICIIVLYIARDFYIVFKGEQILWEMENACIRNLVSEGIERKDIIRNNGSCEMVIKER